MLDFGKGVRRPADSVSSGAAVLDTRMCRMCRMCQHVSHGFQVAASGHVDGTPGVGLAGGSTVMLLAPSSLP